MMKCDECGKRFDSMMNACRCPDCGTKNDPDNDHEHTFKNCNVCGIMLWGWSEYEMGMCERCAGE
jgi:hypothetical protein